MREPKVLLAKRPKDPGNPTRAETLVGHIENVVRVGQALIDVIGPRCLVAMGLANSMLGDLRQAVIMSACLHDIGKANSQFQRALQLGNQRPQALRHEVIGTWLAVRCPQIEEWLFSSCGAHVHRAALFAVLGHHLKVADGEGVKARDGSGDSKIDVFCEHPDFYACLNIATRELGLPSEPPRLPRVGIDLLSGAQLPELSGWLLDANEWYGDAAPDARRFVSLIKALVLAADVAGSAISRTGIDPAEWTADVLSRVCQSHELDEIAMKRLDGQVPRDFQLKVARSDHPVTFVRAGCGCGKTVAAYLWAARWAQGRKLFFCYPTTGTATEGFRDYVIPAEMCPESRLLHSRAEFDLEGMLEDTRDEDSRDEALQHAIRLESLNTWDVPLVICTVDQVLCLIQNGRRALFSSPSLLNSAFVFDEIHQYDDRLFSALLRFIDVFRGVSILLMTASLPQVRLQALQKVLENRGQELNVIEGPPDLEQIPRYILEGPQDEPPWAMIDDTLNEGGKVLWVANTVSRCAAYGKEAKRRGYAPIIYHSRYRYLDRLGKHNAAIDAFRKERALAVTTQVCEVSLDLSADLLITDLSPIPALIQRMGRLNRRVTPENPGSPKLAIVLKTKSPFPYKEADIDLALQWICGLNTGPHSQAALAWAFERIVHDHNIQGSTSAWLDGGPFSRRLPLREAAATIPVIRGEDASMCIDTHRRPITREITRYAIPMPLGPVAAEVGRWKRIGYAFVAPAGRIQYSEEWGATWQEA